MLALLSMFRARLGGERRLSPGKLRPAPVVGPQGRRKKTLPQRHASVLSQRHGAGVHRQIPQPHKWTRPVCLVMCRRAKHERPRSRRSSLIHDATVEVIREYSKVVVILDTVVIILDTVVVILDTAVVILRST